MSGEKSVCHRAARLDRVPGIPDRLEKTDAFIDDSYIVLEVGEGHTAQNVAVQVVQVAGDAAARCEVQRGAQSTVDDVDGLGVTMDDGGEIIEDTIRDWMRENDFLVSLDEDGWLDE